MTLARGRCSFLWTLFAAKAFLVASTTDELGTGKGGGGWTGIRNGGGGTMVI